MITIFLRSTLLLACLGFVHIGSQWLHRHRLLQRTKENLLESAKRNLLSRKQQVEDLESRYGLQDKHGFLYRLDMLLAESGIQKSMRFLSTEIFLGGLLFLGVAAGTGVYRIAANVFFSFCGALLLQGFAMMGVYLLAGKNYQKTEVQLLQFANLLENYAKTSDDLIEIFGSIRFYLEEPLQTAVDECYTVAMTTGDVRSALKRLTTQVEHGKFKEIIRNLEICSLHEANYAEIIQDIRESLMNYLRAKEDRKSIKKNATVSMLVMIGIGGYIVYMANGFVSTSIIKVLTGSLPGLVILAYLFVLLLCFFWQCMHVDRS